MHQIDTRCIEKELGNCITELEMWEVSRKIFLILHENVVLFGIALMRLFKWWVPIARFWRELTLPLSGLIKQTTKWWYFFCFPRKQDLTFHANCLLKCQILFPRKQDLAFHANCLHWRQFAWNAKSCFLGKIRKIFQYIVCRIFYLEC